MRLIGYQEAALKLGVKVGTLYSWVCQGKGPPFVRLSSRCVRFDEASLEAWLPSRVRMPRAHCNDPVRNDDWGTFPSIPTGAKSPEAATPGQDDRSEPIQEARRCRTE